MKHKNDAFDEITELYDSLGTYPEYLISDNGGEFKNNKMRNYAIQNGIKLKFQDSYIPNPNIENVNGQIRELLKHTFVRSKNLIWYNELHNIENNINNHVTKYIRT